MIRILLADDHPIVREGLRAVLETQADFEVIAEAANGDEAIRLALTLQPDIILLDLEMPVLDGVEAIRRLRQQQPGARVIVFTAFDNDERIIHAIQAGANGYLLKGAPREEIFKAIRVTMEGGSLLQPLVASKLLRHVELGHQPMIASQSAVVHRRLPNVPPYEPLTKREVEVLHLLAQGMPNKEIAVQLVISERTAKFHVTSIIGKLGATNRTEAVSLAIQKGLILLRS
ncbi:MAG: response regulator transcription factor [Ktedonobacteraceae bacterium]